MSLDLLLLSGVSRTPVLGVRACSLDLQLKKCLARNGNLAPFDFRLFYIVCIHGGGKSWITTDLVEQVKASHVGPLCLQELVGDLI